MRFVVDENMPRAAAGEIANLGLSVDDARDTGLRGRPDEEVFAAASKSDAFIVTRDRGFAGSPAWPGLAGSFSPSTPVFVPAAAGGQGRAGRLTGPCHSGMMR